MAVVASPHVGGRVVRRVLAIVGAIPLVGFAAVLGQRAGLYASPGSSVVATVASMILATVVALALGRSLDASDDLRRRTEDELRQWKQFFDGASFGAVVGGVDRRFRHVNEAFARMHGFTVAELEGTPIADIFAPHRREELERCIEITHRAGHCRWTSDHLRKDGSVFPVLIDLTAIRDADGQVIYRAASVQDITEETRAEAVRARLAALVESADDAIVAKTLDATVLAWNRGAERVFGWTAEEMIGRSIDIVVPDDRRAERERMCAAMLSGERVVSFETIRVRKDGRRIPIALTTSPIRDGAGRVIGVSTIERDISAIKKLEREREEWTSVVAHDLRQPATAIRIAAGVLDRTEGAARAKAVARIRHASVRLDRMIEDLLDASRTAASRLSIRSDRVSVADVFEDAIGQLPDAAPRCEVHLDPRCPDAIGDTGRLVQVLSNLLSNAAKYGYPDSPIELRAERSGDMVELSVTNEGPGIAADEIPRLFSRFARTFAAQRSTTPGLGLGLYICRGLVEAHGGRLWVESTPGETTSFRFTIPAADRAEARPVM
jgi:PAS domain S-box-containing protein